MRILVVSDSHGNSRILKEIISSKPDIDHIFFLGDVTRDIDIAMDEIPDRKYHIVSGNCDYSSVYPAADLAIINGTKIFFTHGHNHFIKFTNELILKEASERECAIALCGHTHIPDILYENGIYLVNPGSCSKPRSSKPTYAVIDITDKGIMPVIVEI